MENDLPAAAAAPIARLNIIGPDVRIGQIFGAGEIHLNGNILRVDHPIPANAVVVEDGGQVIVEPELAGVAPIVADE